MKKIMNKYVQSILEKLKPHGPITARAMFGGYGIYWEKVMFASIYQDCLYFRVDEENIREYLPYKSHRFVYAGKTTVIPLPYLSLPDEILNDPELLSYWISQSYQAALRYKKEEK